MNDSQDIPWLREMVDDDLAGLFGESRQEISRSVHRLLDHLPYDKDLTTRLLDALQISVDNQNDDTQGSAWIALVLGEGAVIDALPTLIQALCLDSDEELQTAAGIAILKFGAPGVEVLIDTLEEENPSVKLLEAAYELLGFTGSLNDEALRKRVVDFLMEQLDLEGNRRDSDTFVEKIAHSLAHLGAREAIPLIENILQGRFRMQNVFLEDALEMLRDNTSGVVASGVIIPGEEDFRWAFEHDPDLYRPSKGPDAPAAEEAAEEALQEDMEDLENYFRGAAGKPIGGNGKEEP